MGNLKEGGGRVNTWGRVAVALVLIGILAGCSPPPFRPDLDVGDVVEIKIDGARAMVVGIRYHINLPDDGWFVDCRIGTPRQQRRDGLVSADTEIIAYQIVEFREYELKLIEKRKVGE